MISAHETHSADALRAREYLAGWQRARADLENLKKNLTRERQASEARLVRNLMEPLISLADNFAALTRHVPAELKDDAWAAGVLHVARQLTGILEQYSVFVIAAAPGQAFDPRWHEAVEHVKGEGASGKIVEVVQPGYRLDTLVIRPARVKVTT
jgi:molecular chaperone GrpE